MVRRAVYAPSTMLLASGSLTQVASSYRLPIGSGTPFRVMVMAPTWLMFLVLGQGLTISMSIVHVAALT